MITDKKRKTGVNSIYSSGGTYTHVKSLPSRNCKPWQQYRMHKILTILAVFGSLNSMAQFNYTDQSELYTKYGITEVNAFFHDSALVENYEMWKVDIKGRIVYDELLPVDDDSSYSAEIWTYENDQLISRTNIGIWNTKTNKLDTSLTVFFYDSSNNLIREQHTDTKDQDTLIKEYEYSEGLKVKGTLYNEKQEWWYMTDSIVYYDSRTKKTESITKYYNGNPEYKTELYFDTLGVIQAEIKYVFDRNCAIPYQVKNFVYEDGRLIRIKEVHLGAGFVKTVFYSEILYKYNDQGLITKRSRLRGGEVLNFDTFEYK